MSKVEFRKDVFVGISRRGPDNIAHPEFSLAACVRLGDKFGVSVTQYEGEIELVQSITFLLSLADFNVRSFVVDPHNSRELGCKLARNLGRDVYEFMQSSRLFDKPVRRFLKLLRQGRIIGHDSGLLKDSLQVLNLRVNLGGQLAPRCCPVLAAVLMAFSEASDLRQ